MILVGVSKSICTAPDAQDLHSRSTWKASFLYIPANLLLKIFVPETWEAFNWRGVNNYLQVYH